MNIKGLLLIDKPKGWTSFDVVAKVRGQLRQLSGDKKIKVGHAGTLDPMATGLLIVLVGALTKQQDSFMKKDKIYRAKVTFGARSTTDDAEGELTSSGVEPRMPLDQVATALKSYVGEIDQLPPAYSAIKIEGKRAYSIARAGETPKLKTRKVNIYKIESIVVTGSEVAFVCHVSSGTYIRSLARDLGDTLGCGAYLSELRRVSIGEYTVTQAQAISELTEEELQKTLV